MSGVVNAHVHYFDLPWDSGRSDRRVLKKWLGTCLSVICVLGIAIPFIQLPEPEREELEELPPQLARIVMEKPRPVTPPPPPVMKEVEPPQEIAEAKPEQKIVKTEPKVADAKEKASVSGLLAFKDAFADMRDAVDTSKLQDTQALARGAGEAATIDRSVLTSKHIARSSGVNVTELSRDTGGVALAGRETTKVEAPEGAKGTGGVRAQQVATARDRSIEEIRRVFDSNKGAIFAIYNRSLRANPALQGEVVLELVINPAGQVVACKVVASEIADQIMIDKIVNRVRLFNFGERDVGTTTIRYPVHFLPT